jgi:hypothetical protein
MIRPLTNENQL